VATAHYEAMRAWVLASRGPGLAPAGVVAVLRQGVASWLAAGPGAHPARVSLHTATLLPAAISLGHAAGQGALVALLATMIEAVQHAEEVDA
jgi:hypothetical protein